VAANDLENVTRADAISEEGTITRWRRHPRPDTRAAITTCRPTENAVLPRSASPSPGKVPARNVATLVDLAAEDVNNNHRADRGRSAPPIPSGSTPVPMTGRAVGVVMPVNAEFTLYEEPRHRHPRHRPIKSAEGAANQRRHHEIEPHAQATHWPGHPSATEGAGDQTGKPPTSSPTPRRPMGTLPRSPRRFRQPTGHAAKVETPRKPEASKTKILPQPVVTAHLGSTRRKRVTLQIRPFAKLHL